MRKVIAAALSCALLIALLVSSYGCSSCARSCQRLESEYGYGVQRHVELYSATGELTGEWDGVIDVQYRDEYVADLLFFDGDRVTRRVILNVGSGQLVVDGCEQEEAAK